MNKQTSDSISSLAARFMRLTISDVVRIVDDDNPDALAQFVKDVQAIAASALGQDETPGSHFGPGRRA